jgi:hypothetical protein
MRRVTTLACSSIAVVWIWAGGAVMSGLAGPSVFPTGVTLYDPDKAYNSYVLFDGRDNRSYLIDMNGRDVKTWGYSGFPVEMIDPALAGGERGRILAQKEPDNYANKTIIELDWTGRIVWEWGPKAPGGRAGQTHDLCRLANGNTLVLSMRDVVPAAISRLPVKDQVVFEVTRQGDVVWTWVASEHLDEFGLSDQARAQLGSASGRRRSSLLTINNMTPIGPNKWYRAGDARFHPDNIIIDSREANFIAIIQKTTGRVVWRMGPDYPGAFDFSALKDTRQVPRPVDQVSGQHDVHMIADGLPGAGHLLMFDNQGSAGQPIASLALFMGSRVIEVDPVTKAIVWQYDAAASRRPMWTFFSVFVSSARRLPNGNTLICEGMNGRLFQVTRGGEIVWEYVNPHFGRWADHDTVSGGDLTNWVYRAQPVPYAWVPDGTPRSETRVVPPDNSTFRVPAVGK